MLQRTVFINKIRMLQRTQMLQRTVLQRTMLQRTMLQRKVFINKIRMLKRTQMLQRTVFINKIRMLQRTQMPQQTRRNTIGRRNTRVRMTCRAFPLWLERQSSSLSSFVMFSYQFSSFICLFVPLAVKIYIF